MQGTGIPKFDLTALNDSFIEACQDEEFKKYISTLDSSDEILMKYTSTLQECFLEHQNCSHCKGLDSCKNKIQGFCYTPIVKSRLLNFTYESCFKYNKDVSDNSYKSRLDLFELNDDIKNASFKDVYKDDKARVPIIKYFKEFIEQYLAGEKPRGMYLYGSFGSGKTYLIAALFNELAKKGIRSAMVYYPLFLQRLKSSFQTDYGEQFDQIMMAPLLLLDDIGAENVSGWSRDEVLGSILQYRMENHLPTFFTSNLTLEELEKSLSITSSGVDQVKARRILERIKKITVYQELISKDRRK